MTAQELIAELRTLGPQDASVIFHYVANRAIEARLADGQRICDVTDVIAWLRELAEAARVSDGNFRESEGNFRTSPIVMNAPPAQSRWNGRCEDCFHVHTGRYECTEYLGEGRFCKCSAKVSA